jgi:hypothetical protein
VHRTITMPVMANLDGADRVEPVVEDTMLEFQAARAREEAIRLADVGNFEEAARCLDGMVHECDASASPRAREEAVDLRAQAQLLKERRYSDLDRKYDAAMAMSVRENKRGYTRQLREKRGR